MSSKQYLQEQKLTAGVISSPRRNSYQRGRACKEKLI